MFAFPLAWRLSGGVYESHAKLGSDDNQALRTVRHDVQETDRVRDRSLLWPAQHVGARWSPDGTLTLLCQANSSSTAQSECTALVRVATQRHPAIRVVEPAHRPTSPLSLRNEEVLRTSVRNGVLAGLLWLLGCALLQQTRGRGLPKLRIPFKPPAPTPSTFAHSVPPSMPHVFTVPADEPELGRAVREVNERTRLSSAPPKTVDSDRPPTNPATPTGEVAGSDPLRALCRELYLLAGEGCFVIAVTSAPEDRAKKSPLAALLGTTLAEGGPARVLLLEADFDRPAVAEVMDITMPSMAGFSQQMFWRHKTQQSTPWTVVSSSPSLNILAEGRVRTPGMLYTEQFAWAIKDLRRYYDIIVIDGPVAELEVEAKAINDVADGIVFVSPSPEAVAERQAYASRWFHSKRLLTVVPVR